MPTVGVVGVALAGKTTTLQGFARLTGATLESVASAYDRVLVATAGDLRIVTVPGGVFYKGKIRVVSTACDVLVYLTETQPERFEAHREEYLAQRAEIRLTPRVYQVNKVDLRPPDGIRAVLPQLGWTPDVPVFETVAFRNEGIPELFAGVRALLDTTGPGATVIEAVCSAFPSRAAEILTAIDRRWLGWGRRDVVRCPRNGCLAVARIDPMNAIALELCLPLNMGGGDATRVPFSPTALSRDALLAELRRALTARDLERVERNLARDVEERDAYCVTCGAEMHIRARFDAGDWRFE